MIRRAGLLVLVLGSNPVLDAQGPEKLVPQQQEQVATDIRRMSGGVEIQTIENVHISADEVDYNDSTGEFALHGTVVLRQNLRPATQPVAATNRAGVAVPDPKPVMMRIRGALEMAIGDLQVKADEADVNGLTGEMTLRGNVRMIRSKK